MANKILDEDILYQDDLVCILKPNVKKGILVWTNFTQPQNTDSLCKLGLKTGARLHREKVDFGRDIYHPYIFFRAPYKSGPVIIKISILKLKAFMDQIIIIWNLGIY